MTRTLKRKQHRENPRCFHMVGGKGVTGPAPKIRGDVSGLHGNTSGLFGDATLVFGECSGVWGDLTGITGDVSDLMGDLSHVEGCATGLYGTIEHEGEEPIPLERLVNYDND